MNVSIAVSCMEKLLSDEIDVSEIEEMSEWLEGLDRNSDSPTSGRTSRAERGISIDPSLMHQCSRDIPKVRKIFDSMRIIEESAEFLIENMTSAQKTMNTWPG